MPGPAEVPGALGRAIANRLGLAPGAIRFGASSRPTVEGAANLADLADLARRRLPRTIFDFIAGGAEDEATVAANRQAFSGWSLLPRMLVGVERRTTALEVLGTRLSMPVALGPAGLARLAHPDGEVAAASAAAAAGTVFTLSTGSSMSIEQVAAAVGPGHWFQLYLWRDRAVVADLLQRAARAGFGALLLTVDVPTMGRRERDVRNGMAIPPQFNRRAILDVARHPAWLAGIARSEPVTFANLLESPGHGHDAADLAYYTNVTLAYPGARWEALSWVRDHWDGPLAVKGILHPDDARRAVQAGADGIVVSNHGGRQLDGAVASLAALPAVAAAVGDRADVLLDGGVRRGTDIVKALALGARAVLIARPWMLGLGAGGRRGVDATLSVLATELDRALALVGCPDVADAGPSLVVPAAEPLGVDPPGRESGTRSSAGVRRP